jgi:hypothetical protein
LFGELLDFGDCGLPIGSVPRRTIIAADGFEFAPGIASVLARFQNRRSVSKARHAVVDQHAAR